MKPSAGATASQVLEQALGALPASTREELRARLTGATALAVVHIREERFRWMSLFTLPFKLLLWSLIGLVLVWVALQNLLSQGDGGDSGDGDDSPRSAPKPKAPPRYDRGGKDSSEPVYVRRVERPGRSWLPGFLRFEFTLPTHALEVLTSPSDDGLGPFRVPVSNERQGRAAVAALYAVASAAGLRFLEVNQGPPSVVVHRGHGRFPLMLSPGALDLEWARAEVSAAGFETLATEAGLELRHVHSPLPKVFAWVLLVGMVLVSPALFWLARFRHHLLDCLYDVRGAPPGTEVFFVDRDEVGYCYRRAGRTWSRTAVPRSRLHAIVFGEELRFDDQVSYEEPRLRLIGNGSVYPVDYSLEDSLGNAIRDLLVNELTAADSLRPEATGPTRLASAHQSG
ncbi:MAG TPA: hypothetical protein VEY88_05625 [Archangium sp.]|nr:hypothetical protein [Archangium sp.]